MKISAINSNYETKKSLKKNEIKNNANMSTPSFEGMHKSNKVSAKRLALALMAGIAATTPSLQSCTTLDNIVSEFTVQNNTDKKDYYINPEVAEKYPDIDPKEQRSFDLLKKDSSRITDKRLAITSFGTPLYYFADSLDAQLLNYYAQNPQEKNLPNDEVAQGFVDHYNKNKESYKTVASLNDVHKMFNVYKEISKKHNVSEQEAVWNFPADHRNSYLFWLEHSEENYYKKNNYFMNPTPENREKIQDYVINCDGSEYDETQTRIAKEYMNEYSSKVIDEIHRRETNTLAHKKMSLSSSRGSELSKYIENQTTISTSPSSSIVENTTTATVATTEPATKTESKSNVNDASSVQNNIPQKDYYINSKIAEKYPNLDPKENRSFDLYNEDSSWIGNKKRVATKYGKPLNDFADSLDAQLLNYYAQNPQEKNLPNDEIAQGFVDYYNKNKKSYKDEASLNDVHEMFDVYKEISKKHNVSEQEAVWNCPANHRDLYHSNLESSEEDYYKKNNHYMNPTPENREKIQDYTISYNGSKYDETETSVAKEYMKEYSPEVIDEIHKRQINTEIHETMRIYKSKGSDYSNYIEDNKTKTMSLSSFFVETEDTEEHKNFDLYKKDETWITNKRVAITSFGTPLYYFADSLDAQLLNYYAQNPQEKNLPNDEVAQSFVDYYNQNKESYKKEASLNDVHEMFDVYKEISKKHNVSEQEAVWNCPANHRYYYHSWLSRSEDDYYKKNNYFMNPTPENREKIRDYMISYNGSKDNDIETNVVKENMKIYSPETLDEIHKRQINTLIHQKMGNSFKPQSNSNKQVEDNQTITTSQSSYIAEDTTKSTTTPAPAEPAKKSSFWHDLSDALSTVSDVMDEVETSTSKITNQLLYNNLLQQKSTTERQITAQKKLIDSYKEDIKNKKLAISINNGQISDLESRIGQDKRKLSQAESDYRKHKSSDSYSSTSKIFLLDSDSSSINQYKSSINEKTSKINSYKSKNTTLNSELRTLESKLNSANSTLQQLERELQQIKDDLNDLSN